MATIAKQEGAVIKRAPKQQVVVEVDAPSRREFMYYIWGASIVLLLGQSTAGLIWFALPRFKEGEFGGLFRFSGGDLPLEGTAPVNQPAGRFWMSNTSDGYMSLYSVCTHLGCLPKFVLTNNRFECPCHGSKFEPNGAYIEGPAPRGMDVFSTTLVFDDGTTASTPPDGGPIPLNGRQVVEIQVDTGNRILGT